MFQHSDAPAGWIEDSRLSNESEHSSIKKKSMAAGSVVLFCVECNFESPHVLLHGRIT